MKQIVFGIFAHPDDESFGPCAALFKQAQNGDEVHLICVTDGGADGNRAAQIRHDELQAAGEIIGVKQVHWLGYGDGTLCNRLYHEIANKIMQLVRQTCLKGPAEVSFVTFDQNGLTGHLDHIAVSYITTFAFYKLRKSPPSGVVIRELAYYCHSLLQQPKPDLDYFVFSPAGRGPEFINCQVDGHDCLEVKRNAIKSHKSQPKDVASALERGDDWLATENFHVISG